MNNNDQKPDIIQDIDAFLNEGKKPEKAEKAEKVQKPPVPINEEARAAYLAKYHAGETPLPGSRKLPLSLVGVTEATEEKPETYTDEQTGEEWEIPDYTYDPRTPDVPQTKEQIYKQKKTLNTLEEQFYNMEEQDWEIQIRTAMKHKIPTVLVLGESGVGKTTMIENEAAKFGLKVAYFNAATLDPYIQLIGIPYVTKDQRGNDCLHFIRKHDLEHVDMIFLDEINRSPEQVQNQLFELIGARRINGVPFRKLRSVWAAINPPREDVTRYVKEMDTALAGRWYAVIHVEAAPQIHHYVGPKDQIGIKVAEACLSWWYDKIQGQEQEGAGGQIVQLQDIITPRVLYYIMFVAQRLNNDLFHPGTQTVTDPATGATKEVAVPPITKKEWNVSFNLITQHHKISGKSWGINMPFEELKRALLGADIVALSMLRNDSPEIEKWEAEVKEPLRGLEIADKLEAAVRGTQLEGPARIQMAELGDFSRILCAMHKDAAGKVVGRQDIAWYLYAKQNETPEARKAAAVKAGDPNNPIASPQTKGERDIYVHCRPIIDEIIGINRETGAAKKLPVGKAAPAAGAPKVAGGLGGSPTGLNPARPGPPGAPPAGGGKMPFGTAKQAGGIAYPRKR